jgi:hypothetical protein
LIGESTSLDIVTWMRRVRDWARKRTESAP